MTDKPTRQETILLVEDEVLVRVLPIAQYLRECGYRVIEAANADEAMTVLMHETTIVDIVFTDSKCLAPSMGLDWRSG